ncbi:DNA-binding protein [Intrasporangium oryzae NRRL B-24470]|uniref:DNA-binding protein n=1 Tax=Intrasporangium oryzae NRRL B-24470 TaxID=1386089 RepID=W9G3J3_9MICO|nr:helicase-associated domain-containing protein [Intrasporangium oryzae]EWT00701.1 DNA-binding protein [Intrasporangium oryzae NRRL B-24470]
MAPSSRSLADDIRGRSDAELVDLVLARPDLARPAPADLTSLAARASTRASVQRAVEALDRGHLQVLEALVVAADPAPTRVGETADEPTSVGAALPVVLELLGTDDEALVRRLVDDLWRSALLWRSADGEHVVRTVNEVLGGTVAGLGPPMRELRSSLVPQHDDPVALRAAIDEAPDAARAMLEKMTWGPPFGVMPTGRAGSSTARWLLERHLLVPVASDRVALPREVGLALRHGRLHQASQLVPPPLEARRVSLVDEVAGGAASTFLTQVDELTAAWGAAPPRVLRTGGLSVRDLRTTQLTLDVEPELAAFVVEIAYAAGLVADDGEIVPVWAPTADVDEWSSTEAGHRWASLALAWLGSTRAPHLVGQRPGGAAGAVNALGPDVQWPAIRTLRRSVLTELASLGEGEAVGSEALLDRLMWRRPLRPGAVLGEAVGAIVREAEWLGVTGRGALSGAGRALLGPVGRRRAESAASAAGSSARGDVSSGLATATAGDLDEVAAAMSAHLPAPVDHVLVQADLTAVAPGPLVGSLASFMRLAADVESRGGATVYRFTPESVRRALDAGWTAAEFIETVRRSSRTPVPQPLEYLVSDVARRHGQTRIGGAAAYVRSDDESVLDTMLASRDLAALQLRRIAPTVVVSSADPRVLVDLLRDNGFAPVHEGRDGAVVHVETPRRRATTRRRGPGPAVSPVDLAFTQTLVTGLRAAEATADERRAAEESRSGPRIPATDPVVTLSLLRDAVAERHGVWIGLSDQVGGTTRHLIHPQRVEGGRVWATDEGGQEKTFSVHRITGATLEG